MLHCSRLLTACRPSWTQIKLYVLNVRYKTDEISRRKCLDGTGCGAYCMCPIGNIDPQILTIHDELLQVEFGQPRDLLQKDNGILRALVDESGDKESLYAMTRQGLN